MSDVEIFLSHYGVKGMRWGVRKDRAPGASKSTNRAASKDAKEFARAKLYYGDGAGNRRKLIKAKVESRSKVSSEYKKAFDYHLSKQDLSKHSDKARVERKKTDRKTRNKQRRGAVARRLTGEMGTQAAFVALTAGGIAYLASPAGQRVRSQGMSKIKDASNEIKRRQGAAYLKDFLN